ncbi:hypothetical protein D3C85_1097590 [compost metagenome]
MASAVDSLCAVDWRKPECFRGLLAPLDRSLAADDLEAQAITVARRGETGPQQTVHAAFKLQLHHTGIVQPPAGYDRGQLGIQACTATPAQELKHVEGMRADIPDDTGRASLLWITAPGKAFTQRRHTRRQPLQQVLDIHEANLAKLPGLNTAAGIPDHGIALVGIGQRKERIGLIGNARQLNGFLWAVD